MDPRGAGDESRGLLRDLPLINRDVLSLVSSTAAGVRGGGGEIIFSGATSGMINTTTDATTTALWV